MVGNLFFVVYQLRYSYDYGLVHFIMMSTEHDVGKGSRQYLWLEKDLQNVDRVKTPWIILAGHRPMYNSQLTIGIVILLFNSTFNRLIFYCFFSYQAIFLYVHAVPIRTHSVSSYNINPVHHYSVSGNTHPVTYSVSDKLLNSSI